MKVNKIKLGKILVQVVYLVLIIMGFFSKLRPLSGILMLASLMFGNFYCGWVCPFGTIQDFMAKLGSLFIKRKYKMPYFIQKYLQFSRYIIMISILLVIGRERISNPVDSYHAFISILNGRSITVLAMVFLVSFLLIALFFERPFCNYLCAEGITYGVASFTRLFSIKRDKETCISCGKCDKSCPMNINVSKCSHVRNAQCINCFNCIDSCPVKGTLKYGSVVHLIKNIFKKKIKSRL